MVLGPWVATMGKGDPPIMMLPIFLLHEKRATDEAWGVSTKLGQDKSHVRVLVGHLSQHAGAHWSIFEALECIYLRESCQYSTAVGLVAKLNIVTSVKFDD